MVLTHGDIERPEKTVVGRAFADEPLDDRPVLGRGAMGKVPFQGAVLAVERRIINLPLPARTDEFLDFAALPRKLQPNGLSRTKGVHEKRRFGYGLLTLM
jgi:hypothetical protein